MRTHCFLAVTLLAMPVVETALAQTPAPMRGDIVIEKYLTHTAARLSQRLLDGARTLKEWEARRPRLKEEFLDMLGLWPLPEKTPLKPTITGTIQRDTFVIEKLHFQSRPGLYVTANLYRPKQSQGKLPAVVLFMGHYNRGRNGHKAFMQDHGMWFATNGYVCLILDTIERSELPGRSHHGLYRDERWWWLSAGFTMAGLETWNGIRAIDYLVSRSDVDPTRITATGLSGGGSMTYFVTAADERVTCAVPASGMTDLESNVTNRLMAIHCDCQIPYNVYGWEFTTIAALITPRPLLFVNSHDDVGFPMAANRRIMARLRTIYDLYKKPDRLDQFVSQGPPGGHEYRPDSRVAIFRWINKHNKGTAGIVKDADFKRIPEEQLRVFPKDSDFPKDAINLKADDHFVRLARVSLPKAEEFTAWKRDLIQRLRERSFHRFPERIPVSDRVPSPGNFKFRDLPLTDRPQTRTTEIGIEVTLKLHGLDTQGKPREKPVTLIVLNEDEMPGDIPPWARRLIGEEAVALLSPRGSGPNRFTRQSPVNFVPRALALLGQTVDDGRVWDIAATARWLERKAGVRIIGRGQSGVLAAYAALFEPSICQVLLLDPPASHRSGPYFLNVLRTLDIPDALGLLAPTPLTLIDAKDKAFDRTAEIYRLAGAAKNLRRQ
jgi:dienelactone hydrolase